MSVARVQGAGYRVHAALRIVIHGGVYRGSADDKFLLELISGRNLVVCSLLVEVSDVSDTAAGRMIVAVCPWREDMMQNTSYREVYRGIQR